MAELTDEELAARRLFNRPPGRYLTPYLKDHPLALAIATASALLGFLLVLDPAQADDSPVLALMPTWGVVLWGVVFWAGGVFSTVGLVFVLPKWEAAGCALLAASFVTVTIGIVYLPGPVTPLSLLFMLGLALGYAAKAWLLAVTP